MGAGAVGGTVAARLARAGVDVAVIDSNEEHVSLLADRGLVVDGLDQGMQTPLAAATSTDAVSADPDVVLLAVRSGATRPAVESIASRLRDDGDVVSLQNGLNEHTIASIVGDERTTGCVVGFGATWIEPGRVSLDAGGDLTIGRLDGRADDRLDSVCKLLTNAFPTKITDNIRGALWGKMLVNSMTVLGALGGMITGELLGTRERRRTVAAVVAEGARVARAESVELPMVFGLIPPALVDDSHRWDQAMERVLVRFGEAFGAIRSVTWRDIELGRPTEIDAVTGEISKRGQRNGVPTPLNSAAYEMLREIEAGGRAPDPANLKELAETAT